MAERREIEQRLIATSKQLALEREQYRDALRAQGIDPDQLIPTGELVQRLRALDERMALAPGAPSLPTKTDEATA